LGIHLVKQTVSSMEYHRNKHFNILKVKIRGQERKTCLVTGT
jgi:hypothetical protein